MSDVPDKSTFESLYAGQAPWDIGRPQKPFIDESDQIDGSVLDAGCGTGDTALFLASRGYKVTGIDFLEEPIRRAKRKALEQNLPATFLVKDATALIAWSERFDNVIDSGLFHVFSDSDRKKYVEGLATVLKSGGRLFLMCFSDEEPGTQGPRRVSQKELHDAFSDGWVVESIKTSRFKVAPNLKDFTFSEGGPKSWFAVIRRT
ncbi:MAG: class I SAM-dependent methyltransferase [Planctomycetes bacterium]|nr:class I SAM-dependent methyltransferase [Planctomycetota bacterium]